MGAAMNGHADVVALLLERGAFASSFNTYGETARAIAEEKGHTSIVDAIRQREAAPSAGDDGSDGSGTAALSMGQAADMLASYLDTASQISREGV